MRPRAFASSRPVRHATSLTLLCVCGIGAKCGAQESEPRAYSPSPTGVNFLVIALGRSAGSVLTDPSLPVENVEATIGAAAAGYGRTFGLAGRSANAALVVPYLHADVSGDVGEERASVTRSGIGDTKLRFAVNLRGAPAMTPQEFARRRPATTLGASITVSAPTGQYDAARLVNIGTNRWAAKTELGVSHPVGKWLLEGSAGLWWFSDNGNFRGARREQDPLMSLQAHLSYTFRPRLWVALDTTFYEGGATTIDGVAKHDRKSNGRAGVTASLPMGRAYSLKLDWSRGATTRIGSSFTTFGLAVQYAWLDRP